MFFLFIKKILNIFIVVLSVMFGVKILNSDACDFSGLKQETTFQYVVMHVPCFELKNQYFYSKYYRYLVIGVIIQV